jgi:hypothetical protein
MADDSEDLYGSGDEAPVSKPNTVAEGEDAPEEGSDETKGEGSETTALIPETLCPGMQPGDEMVVTIKSVMDGQYQVAYSPEPKSKDPDKAPAPVPQGDSELASMME